MLTSLHLRHACVAPTFAFASAELDAMTAPPSLRTLILTGIPLDFLPALTGNPHFGPIRGLKLIRSLDVEAMLLRAQVAFAQLEALTVHTSFGPEWRTMLHNEALVSLATMKRMLQ